MKLVDASEVFTADTGSDSASKKLLVLSTVVNGSLTASKKLLERPIILDGSLIGAA